MKYIILSFLLGITFFISVNTWGLPIKQPKYLSWDSFTTNIDGTQVSDAAGYKVYWSNISGSYNDINVKDVGKTTNININFITSLKGLVYFVVTAYDKSGNESDFSNEVSGNFYVKKSPPSNVKLH